MTNLARLLNSALAATAILSSASLFGQAPFNCGTDQARQKAIQHDPGILDREAALEQFTHDWIQEHEGMRDEDTVVYVIPVIFHVLHMDGPENISDAQILDEMAVLNRDYRKLNADTNVICCGFGPICADIRLEFRLATIDPLGNPTTGIDRVRTCETYVGDNGSKIHVWRRDAYLNVWTASLMQGGAAGYSQYPSAVDGDNVAADGVMILNDYVGRIGTGQASRSRALTHEIGHYLNLKHPWGDTNNPGVECGDDDVEDTPITMGWDHCPTPAQSQVCVDTLYENFQNYMDYSYCSVMYTEDQKSRMRAALNSGVASRDQLWKPATLAMTGIDGVTNMLGAPQADFYPALIAVNVGGTPRTSHFVCIGDDVPFHDNSQRGVPTSWQWTFQDGDPSTSTEQNPTVSFTSGGWKSVTLTASNDQGSSTRTNEFTVNVANPWPDINGLLSENFEDPNSGWQYMQDNYEGNTSQWARVTNAGHYSNASFRIDGFNTLGLNDFPIDDGANDIDALVTPTVDLSNVTNIHFNFWFSYATRTSSIADVTERLEVWATHDCGRHWLLLRTVEAAELITDGAYSGFYIPSDPNSWRNVDIPLSSSWHDDQVRFKFIYYSSAASNNLYIDDLQTTGTVGVDELSANGTMDHFPNPTDNTLHVHLNVPGARDAIITVEDMTGRVVLTRNTGGNGSLADTDLDLDVSALAAGNYILRVVHSNGQLIGKFSAK